jgi:8-oxo-dGTP diphosphatase
LKLHRTVNRLLVHDWAPNDTEGDKILYVFDCGELGNDEERIRFDGTEIDTAKWVSIDDISDVVIPRLARRLEHAYRAYMSGEILYLENGCPRKIP